jgi:hypothetical protein
VAEAGARAAVSASFAIEQFGVPMFDEQTCVEAERRLAWAKERIEGVGVTGSRGAGESFFLSP